MQTAQSLTRALRYHRLLWLLPFVLIALGGQSPGFVQSQSPLIGQSVNFQEIASGIEWGQITAGQASKDDRTGPWFINALRIDPARARLQIVHALDEGVGLETVSSIAARYGATAATNGGYFRVSGTYRGESVGLLVLDHKLISEPHNDREEFGLIENENKTDVIFGHLKFAGEISTGRVRYAVKGVNRPLAANELVVFTPEFHRTTLTNADGTEVVVERNRATTIRHLQGSATIPAGGFVISAVGKSREWVKQNIRRGTPVKFSWRLKSIEPDQDQKWQRAYTILGGGPQLIKNGRVEITNTQEKITPAFVNDGHSRTAIARLSSGKLLLITIDGRQPGEGIGIALTTLANLLLELGAVEAMNLDGGGSTTMVIHNKIVNRPSDQAGERPVGDAILVFPRPH